MLPLSKSKDRIFLLVLLLAISFVSLVSAQEICVNGIDDDGDGQIDLNDSECFCTAQTNDTPSSLIPNPSFEDQDCCPGLPSQMGCALDWRQASAATSDYFNTCGFVYYNEFPTPPTPFPNGNGFVGFIDKYDNYKEYIGACLTSTTVPNESYTIEFDFGFGAGGDDFISSSPYELVMYGTTDCTNLPFGGQDYFFGCATNDPSWVELGSAVINGQNEWISASITFLSNVSYSAIVIGPSCVENSGIPAYYFLDDLVIARTKEFGDKIAAEGDFCKNDLVLTINSFDDAVYQWFLDGVAIAGATDTAYHVPPNAFGDYEAMIILPTSDCSLTDVFVVETHPLDASIAVSVPISCYGRAEGSLSASVFGGTAPYTYLWSTNDSFQTIENLYSGNYSVTITDRFGCFTSTDFNLGDPAFYGFSATQTNGISCYGVSDGAAIAVVTGGLSPYSYLWDNNETTANPVNLGYGWHSLSVTDATDCTVVDSLFIGEDPAYAINLIGLNNVSCNGGSDGSIAINIVGGEVPYDFNWSNSATTQNLNNIGAGDYTLTLTDNIGCSRIFMTEVEEPSPLEVEFSEDSLFCYGITGTGTFPTGGTPPYSYLWDTGVNIPNPDDLAVGDHTVTVTDANGCTTTKSIFIAQRVEFISAFETVPTLCFGSSDGQLIITQIEGAFAPYMYAVDDGTFVLDSILTGLSSGNYTLTIEDANGCQIQQAFSILDPPLIVVDAGQNQTIGLGESTELDANVYSFWPYTTAWSPEEFLLCDDTLNCFAPTVVQPLYPTTYTFMVTDINGCVGTDEVFIDVKKDQGVFIPNVFTPNGDGINDFFTIMAGPSVAQVKTLRIFDRWGELVFEGKNFNPNTNAMGWNGEFKGKTMNPSVFVYYAELEFIDGRSIPYEGEIALLR